jgi:hypothetical protein
MVLLLSLQCPDVYSLFFHFLFFSVSVLDLVLVLVTALGFFSFLFLVVVSSMLCLGSLCGIYIPASSSGLLFLFSLPLHDLFSGYRVRISGLKKCSESNF